MSTEELATLAQTTIDKLRADIAETERDIAFQEMRREILLDTLQMLTGAPVDARTRAPRKRRTAQPESATSVADQDRTAADLLGAAA
jgi:hypothetical protein